MPVPTHVKFGGGVPETAMHPIVALALVGCAIAIWALPRRHVIIPLLFTTLMVPIGQVLVILGAHFTPFRILVVAGIVRIACTSIMGRRATGTGRLNSIDRAFYLYALVTVGAFLLLWQDTGAAMNRLGFALDTIGGYGLFRYAIFDRSSVYRMIRVLAVVCALNAAVMLNEHWTQRNVLG